MKKTEAAKKTGNLVDVRTRARVSIFDRYFSTEQQVQIIRLQSAGDFEGITESEAVDKTIATLAAAALYALGLDPISEDALSRISDVVYGEESGFSADLFNAINDRWQTAEIWTKRQRDAELGEVPLKGRAA
jgi:hypothetical protein